MSEFIKAQQEVRANLFEQIKDVITSAENEGRGLDSTELEKIDRIEKDIEAAERSIETAEKAESRAVEASAAAKGFLPAEPTNDNDALRSLLKGETRDANFEMRATVTSSDNLVDRGFADQIFMRMREVGPLLQTSEVISTNTSEDIVFPTFGNFSSPAQRAEGVALPESEPTFSSITLGAFKYGALIPVSNTLLNDSSLNIQNIIAEQAANALQFQLNLDHTTGSGSSEPNGIVTASTDSGITGDAGTISADETIQMLYSVDQGYRNQNAGFMAATNMARDLRLLKDGDQRFLYEIRVGEPDQVAGYRLVENRHMAYGDGEKSLLFGDLSQYKIRFAGGIDVASSTDFAFNEDVTTIRVMAKADGDIAQGEAIRFYTQGTA